MEGVRRLHESGEDVRILENLRRSAEAGAPPVVPAAPPEAAPATEPPWPLLDRLHRLNFMLWHVEDEARRTDAGDRYVATTKRWIDPLNQARNDSIEAIDAALEGRYSAPATAPLATETPGAALDRLSILALKIHHTEQEAARADAAPAHRARMEERLALLRSQGDDLRAALRAYLDDLAAGRRRFRRYRQFKMYNDPETNPAVRRGRG